VLSYIAAVYKPLETISSTMGSLQQQLVMVQGAFMLLDTEPEIRDAADAIEARDVRGDVVFDGVSFTYAGRDHTLEDISFGVQPGQCIALVGPTGAGKTTLISLLMRFYDPTAGRVLLERERRSAFTVSLPPRPHQLVLQVPELFSGTIATTSATGGWTRRRRRSSRRRSPRTPTGSSAPCRRATTRNSVKAAHSSRRRTPADLRRARLPEGRTDPRARRADVGDRLEDGGN